MLALIMLFLAAAAPAATERHHQAVTAYKMAAWARSRSDAPAMLAAARMLADAGVRTAHSTPAAAELAEEAVTMAPTDPQVLAAAAAIRDATPRGILRGPLGDGPVAMRRLLPAGASLAVPVTAHGGEMAIVSAVGDGDANIDMVVTSGRRLVCVDRAADAYPMCRWRVTRDASFDVAIANRGRIATHVVVLSN